MKTLAPGTRCPHKLRLWAYQLTGRHRAQFVASPYLVRCKLEGPHDTHKNRGNTW